MELINYNDETTKNNICNDVKYDTYEYWQQTLKICNEIISNNPTMTDFTNNTIYYFYNLAKQRMLELKSKNV
jgi:hypothetical protein